jgi:hypothetical protein
MKAINPSLSAGPAPNYRELGRATHFQTARQPVPCSADKRNYRAYRGAELFTAPLKKAALIVQAIRIACGFDA